MTFLPLPSTMVPPGQKRPGIMRGGVLQIHITRACDQSCFHCTQGSNLAGKPVMMTPEQFTVAVDSLDGYFGVIGIFGGNPTSSPHFDVICEIFASKVPYPQRGIWTNNLQGKGSTCRRTFNPSVSNLNVHLDQAARAEFVNEWPESRAFVKGHNQDSVHSAPFVAMKDVIADEAERWRLIGGCDVNQNWSALIGVVPGRGLRAYFCELAYAQAALHATADDADQWPDTGLEVTPGWWRQPMDAFDAQVRLHCHACGIPMRRQGQQAIGGEFEEFSATHTAIARPKKRDRQVAFVGIDAYDGPKTRYATDYLPNTTPNRPDPPMPETSRHRHSCGCVNAVDPASGVMRSQSKCAAHKRAYNDPTKLDASYYGEFGLIKGGRLQLTNHVAEIVDALGPFPEATDGHSRALEIGTGVSPYCPELQRLGWAYTGLDPSTWACDWMATTFGVAMKCGEFRKDSIDITFDLILAAHSIEHMEDAPSAIGWMSDLLNPGGELRIVIPDDMDPVNPDHLWFFTPASLVRTVNAAGLVVEAVEVRKIVAHENFIYLKARKPVVRVA